MRSDDSEVQLSLFESNELPWQSLPNEVRCPLVEFLAHLLKDEVETMKNTTKEEAKDA